MPFAVTAVRRTSPIIFVVLTLYYLFVLRGQNNADDKNYRNITFPPLKKVADVREKKVAIIGAGAGGSSTAYHLRKLARESNIPLHLTVFEQNSYVGGRSTTVDAYGNSSIPIELGASVFVEVNTILYNAAREFGLDIVGESEERPRAQQVQDEEEFGGSFAIYNGKETVFYFPNIHNKREKWWNNIKVLWRYGLAPIQTQRETAKTMAKFSNLYIPPIFPFNSLTKAIEDVELMEQVGVTGQQYLDRVGIKGKWTTELMQASTRVNYGQNLGLIHGVETLVCMAAEGAIHIRGGNWRIFAGMLEAAQANLRLETIVKKLRKTEKGSWMLSYQTQTRDLQTEEFDEVVLAGPYQFAGIEVDSVDFHRPDPVPYATLHVTLFSSPHLFPAERFNLSRGVAIPEAIITTLTEEEQANSTITSGEGKVAVGQVGFFSISILRKVPRIFNGKQRFEYIYKVFSPEEFSDDHVRDILGLKGEMTDSDLTWTHRKIWNPYPYEYPRVTFEELSLDKGLWYTSGIESFISTMETSALMGGNIAGLIMKSWTGNEDVAEDQETQRDL